MPAGSQRQARLIALDALLELSDQLGADTCRQYVSNFVSMWESRYARLSHAVQDADYDAAMDVVLSIKISSHMAGAERLSSLGAAAQDLVARRDAGALAEMMLLIRDCGMDTVEFLSESLHVSSAA